MSGAADEIDYFADHAVLRDPYRYFDELRPLGAVHQLKSRDTVAVTGFREAVEVLLNHEDFSLVNCVVPTQALPVAPQADDISEQIEAHRARFERADIPVALAAANRDPARWENPAEFRLNRERTKEHLAFGRGAHTCIGNPPARAEIRVILEHFLDQTSDVTLSEKHHGPPRNREFNCEPTYIIPGAREGARRVEGEVDRSRMRCPARRVQWLAGMFDSHP